MTRAEYIAKLREDPSRAEILSDRAADIADTESAFKRRLAKIRESGEQMSQKEFEKWEADYADNWEYMRRDLERMDYDNDTQEAMEYQAKVQSRMFTSEGNLENSIEAYSGNFFHERMQVLRSAIEASDSKTKESDLRLLGSFWSSVAEHLDCRYMTQSEIRDQYGDSDWELRRFDQRRTEAHNSAITHLNMMNDIAKKYGAKPFTPRNFWTSRNQRQTSEMSNRMSYDRHVFEAFYTHAFGNERIAQIKRKHEQNRYW